MPLDRHRMTQSSFSKYYDVFLDNWMKRRTFKITLVSGETAVGVPIAGTVVSRLDPCASFKLKTRDGGVHEIPFVDLAKAEIEPAS